MNITSKAYWAFLGVCVAAGAGGTILGIVNLQIALRYSRIPQSLSYADLISHGPGDNVHIVLTDFTPRWDGAFYIHHSNWHQVYLPVGPENHTGTPTGREVGVILVLQDDHYVNALDRVANSNRFTGIVKSYGATSHYAELRRYNPGIAPDQCWQIDQEYQPWSVVNSFWALVFSIPAFALGGFLFFRAAIEYSSKDRRTQEVMLALSPLLLVAGAVRHWCQGRLPASAAARAMILVVVGLCLLALGGLLVHRFLFISPVGLSGAMMLGTFSLNIGFALFAVGALPLLREREEPTSSGSTGIEAVDRSRVAEQSRLYRRYFGWGSIGIGVGLLVAAFQTQQEDSPSAGLPITIGIAVTGCLVGAILLVADRKSAE